MERLKSLLEDFNMSLTSINNLNIEPQLIHYYSLN